MAIQTPATAEIEKWLRVRFFTNFWLRFRTRNAESCRSRTTPDPWLSLDPACRDDRNHFFRLRLRLCTKMFESGSGNFSNLRIRLLFWLRLPSIQSKFTNVFTLEMTMQTLVIAENEKWLRAQVLFFTNFWLRIRIRRKNAESCRCRTTPALLDPWPQATSAS